MTFGILGERSIPSNTTVPLNCFLGYRNPEDHKLGTVPGTGLLSDQGIVHGHEVAIDAARNLKRGSGKHSHVVLIPQPSDDPHDPYVVIPHRVS